MHQFRLHRRKGFLLTEVVAGAGLLIIVLGLTLTILKRDGDLRQRNESRATILRTAENLLEQYACLPFDQLTPELATSLAESARQQSGNPGIQLSIEIQAESAPLPFKRLHLAGALEGGPVLVHLWREYYGEGKAK